MLTDLGNLSALLLLMMMMMMLNYLYRLGHIARRVGHRDMKSSMSA